MPERKHARAPDAVWARPLSWASYPVATGRPRPGHQRPRALRLVEEPRGCFGATPLVGELPRSNGQTTAWPSAPSRVEAGGRGKRGARKSINLNSDPGGPSRSSSIAPAETILAAADSSAPTRQGLRDKEPARNAGVKARPRPPMLFWRAPSRWRATP